jgi:predicted dehydrogenase
MNIGIIGTGAMSLRLLKSIKGQVPNVRFTAAHNHTPEKLIAFSRQHPEITPFHDLRSMLSNSNIDAVYICTPVHTHRDLTIQAAKAGKHVLCEKPMALTLSDCQTMIESTDQNNVTLQIGYMMRFHPIHQYIKQEIENGTLGKINFVHIERTAYIDFLAPDFPKNRLWFVDKAKSGGGAFMDLGSHVLDLLLYYINDEIEESSYHSSIHPKLTVEMTALASLRFSSGTLATVLASWDIAVHDNYLQVYGDRASIQAIRSLGPYTDGEVYLIKDGERKRIEISYQNHYINQFTHFYDCAFKGLEPLTSGRNCLRTEQVRQMLMSSA